MSACSVTPCTRPSRSRGLCGTHYERLRVTGTTAARVHVPATCAAPDCVTQVFSNSWCKLHHSRIRHSGRLDLQPTRTVADRLANGSLAQDDGCLLWIGTPRANGYGAISVGDRLQYVHRLSYELHVGPIPDGLTIDHLCRVRLCIQPGHLEAVTREENTRRELTVRYAKAGAS